MPPTALVVADEEEEAGAFVQGTFVRHRVHQHERIRPPDLRLELRLCSILNTQNVNFMS
jgi:hypothetical protein